MAEAGADGRGVISGALNLSRSLGLITGTAALGTVFALASGSNDSVVDPTGVSTGLHATFGLAAALVIVAVAITVASGRPSRSPVVADAATARTRKRERD
jgi:hypothetical protein